MRRAPGHKDNLFGDPYNTKMTIIEEQEAKARLQKFIQSIDLYVLDRQSPLSGLYKTLRLRQRALLKREAVRKKKCLEEKSQQNQSKNQSQSEGQEDQRNQKYQYAESADVQNNEETRCTK